MYCHNKNLKELVKNNTSKNDISYITAYSSFKGEIYENIIYELLLEYVLTQDEITKFVLKGPYQAKENHFIKSGLLIDSSSQIVYKSAYKDISELYSVMDLLAYPSLYEGLGMVLVEAQASDLSCIASPNGTREAIVSNRIQLVPLDSDLWLNRVLLEVNVRKRILPTRIKTASFIEYDISASAKSLAHRYLFIQHSTGSA